LKKLTKAQIRLGRIFIQEKKLDEQKARSEERQRRIKEEEERLNLPVCSSCGEHRRDGAMLNGKFVCISCITTGKGKKKEEDSFLKKLGLIK
jgi:hypothetical protein